jgi:hypothetical protein
MTIDTKHLTDNWKSTAQSFLTVTFAVTGYLMTSSVIKPHTAVVLGIVNGLAKVILGIYQQDGVVIPANSTISQSSSTTIKTP